MEKYSEFCLEIDFARGIGDPTRVFRTMTSLITALQNIDEHLINSIHPKIVPVVALEDVRASSVKAFLSTLLNQVDDDALKNLDWKPLVGQYLVKAKYTTIKFLKDNNKIKSLKQVDSLRSELLEIAKDTNVRQIPYYQPITQIEIIEDIKMISDSTALLDDKDNVYYKTDYGDIDFNKNFTITAENIEELIIRESISNNEILILKVKKPDYLGESKWQFYAGKIIEAKIEDFSWLKNFQKQSGAVEVLPGDSLRAMVRHTIKYGYSGDVVSEDFVITKVIEVLKAPKQSLLF